jgi:hypothetical protein
MAITRQYGEYQAHKINENLNNSREQQRTAENSKKSKQQKTA